MIINTPIFCKDTFFTQYIFVICQISLTFVQNNLITKRKTNKLKP